MGEIQIPLSSTFNINLVPSDSALKVQYERMDDVLFITKFDIQIHTVCIYIHMYVCLITKKLTLDEQCDSVRPRRKD